MVAIIWMKIANESLLRPTAEGINKYAPKDKKYRIAAIPVTTSKFGPSGSLKNTNIILEHASAVIANISSEVFFDVKYISSLLVLINFYAKHSYLKLSLDLKSD